MAENKIRVFAQDPQNMVSDNEYDVSSQRQGGVSPGIADPRLHNKLFHQVSIMAAALAEVILEGSAVDITDEDMSALVEHIRRVMVRPGQQALPALAYTAADVLAKLKTVGGTGSGLDADTVDGKHAADFATKEQGSKADAAMPSADFTPQNVVDKANNWTGLNADTLDGEHASGFIGLARYEGDILTLNQAIDGLNTGKMSANETAATIAMGPGDPRNINAAIHESQQAKLLWSGSWSAGSITVTGLHAYRTLKLRSDRAAFELIFATGDGSASDASGGPFNLSGDTALVSHVAIEAVRSGDTLTLSGVAQYNLGPGTVEGPFLIDPITHVYGGGLL